MRLGLGRPRAALIVAPHPDDEIIGAAALIRALVRRGTAVRVAIVTDGAASHPNSRLWPRRRLVAARRAESRRALRRLGVLPPAIRFLDLADGAADIAACRGRLAAAVRHSGHLTLIVGPALGDAHPDHRAVAEALRGLSPATRRLAYRVWPPRATQRGAALALPCTAAAKRSLIRVYRSQLGGIADDPGGFAMARHELDAFARSPERFEAVR